jgi:membrane-bound lytic murein transglycosylase A
MYKNFALLLLFLVSCSPKPKLVLQKTDFTQLVGWNLDNHQELQQAYEASCKKFDAKQWQDFYEKNGISGDPSEYCTILGAQSKPAQEFKTLLEENFTPYEVLNHKNNKGLYTGYYELDLTASLTPTEKYKYPIYARPDDLALMRPYYTREEIESGILKGRNLEIAYTDDPVRLFFLHIQGSGILHFENGESLRITYDGQNGHKYFPIGKYLKYVEKIRPEEINALFIMNWLRLYAFKAQKIMNYNKSYIFFRKNMASSPIGAQNLPLTPGRSLAIDRKFFPLGSVFWLNTTSTYKNLKINKLFVAQDTGGAIKGVVRGDIFFGKGFDAEKQASSMKNIGVYYILLPKNHVLNSKQ